MDCLDVRKKVEQNESILHLFLIYPCTNRLITSAWSLPFVRCVSKVDGPLWSGRVTKWQLIRHGPTRVSSSYDCLINSSYRVRLCMYRIPLFMDFHFLNRSSHSHIWKTKSFLSTKISSFFLYFSEKCIAQNNKKVIIRTNITIFLSTADSSHGTIVSYCSSISRSSVYLHSQSSTAHSSNDPHSSMK